MVLYSIFDTMFLLLSVRDGSGYLCWHKHFLSTLCASFFIVVHDNFSFDPPIHKKVSFFPSHVRKSTQKFLLNPLQQKFLNHLPFVAGGGYVISPLPPQGGYPQRCLVKHMLTVDWKHWKTCWSPPRDRDITLRVLERVAGWLFFK